MSCAGGLAPRVFVRGVYVLETDNRLSQMMMDQERSDLFAVINMTLCSINFVSDQK